MRVALAHKLFRLTGGAEVFFHETDRLLREAGHDTLMIATGDSEADDEQANVLRLTAPEYDAKNVMTKVRSLPAAIYDRDKKRKVKAALREFRPDLLHVFAINVHLSPSIVTAANELGIPVVGTFNDYKHICPNYKLYHHNKVCYDCKGQQFWRAIKNKCCKDNVALSIASALEAYIHGFLDVYGKFDHFTFSSDFMARKTLEFWPERNVSWSKFHNPFNSRVIHASDVYDAYGLYFGRIIDEKGVDRIIEAAAIARDVPLKIIGDGPDLQKIKARAAALNLENVEFLGSRWGNSLNEVLKRARFVVVPSIWHENFPYVINQAFAYGRPVIGARRGGITELVEHGVRGLVFEPDQVSELASAMQTFYSDAGLARQMGNEAKAWSDHMFCDEIAYSQLIHAYEEAKRAHNAHRR